MTAPARPQIVGSAPRLPFFKWTPRLPWIFGLATLLLFTVGTAHPQTATAPNILFIFADDLGWRDTGFMGSDFYETPHLDQFPSGKNI